MTDKNTEEELKRVHCIWYYVIFKDQIEVLLDSGSEINAISLAFTSHLGLKIWKTNFQAHNINSTILKTYGIVVFTFTMLDKDGSKKICEESFLLAEVKPKIVLRILFLTMSNADVDFQAWDL